MATPAELVETAEALARAEEAFLLARGWSRWLPPFAQSYPHPLWTRPELVDPRTKEAVGVVTDTAVTWERCPASAPYYTPCVDLTDGPADGGGDRR